MGSKEERIWKTIKSMIKGQQLLGKNKFQEFEITLHFFLTSTTAPLCTIASKVY